MQALTVSASEPRSYCPINLSLEIFGDTWTLLVLRDMMFAGKRHFRELLQSDEHIASNILADRLARLVEHGLLTKHEDPTHKQKAIYSLTEKAIALLPIVVQIGAWGSRWVPDAKKLDRAARTGGMTASEILHERRSTSSQARKPSSLVMQTRTSRR